MAQLLRRTLLVSTTAFATLAFVPFIGSFVPSTLASFVVSQAEARGGDDDGGGSDDSGSGSDDSGNDSSDDSSGRDRDRDRDRNRSGDDDNDRNDDSDDDRSDDGDDDSSGSGNGDRDEVRLIVNNTQLQGLLGGSLMPVDQNGKRLRFEVEQEDGGPEIKLRAPRGTLQSVTVVPAT